MSGLATVWNHERVITIQANWMLSKYWEPLCLFTRRAGRRPLASWRSHLPGRTARPLNCRVSIALSRSRDVTLTTRRVTWLLIRSTRVFGIGRLFLIKFARTCCFEHAQSRHYILLFTYVHVFDKLCVLFWSRTSWHGELWPQILYRHKVHVTSFLSKLSVNYKLVKVLSWLRQKKCIA